MRRIVALDGIRGIAILGVLGEHTGLLPGGHLGVTVFFTLSGYLITSLLLDEHGRTGRIDLRAFYRRRFARLMPAFLVAVAATTALAAVVTVTPFATYARRSLLPALTYTTDFVTAGTHGWGGGGPLAWSWSLAIEEQFYLLWPGILVACLWLGRLRLARGIAWLGCAVAVAERVMWAHPHSTFPLRLYAAPDTRMDSILVGCLLALALQRRERLGRWVDWAGAGGLVVLALAYLVGDHDLPVTYLVVLPVAEIATAAVIAAVVRGGLAGHGLERPWLVYLGVISYSVYLWNLFPAVLWNGLTGRLVSGWWSVAVIAAGAALGAASYRWVEKPARAWLRGDRRRRVAVAAPAVGAAEAA